MTNIFKNMAMVKETESLLTSEQIKLFRKIKILFLSANVYFTNICELRKGSNWNIANNSIKVRYFDDNLKRYVIKEYKL